MTIPRRVALMLGVVATLSSCRTGEEKAKSEQKALTAREQRFESRLAKAEQIGSDRDPVAMWIMPRELQEISGLALTPDGRLLAHDDELARVYEIDPRRGVVIKSFILGKGLRGDFEGITVAGQDIYMALSNGTLYRFREGANGAQVPYTVHDLKLGKECEFEGVTYEKDSAWLVLPCKTVHLKHLDDEVVIYRWKIGTAGSAGISMLTVPISEVAGSNKWKKFRPSDITIDPSTGNYVLLSSLEKGIVVITPEGDVVESRPLPGKHRQAEGIAITSDGVLIVSDEGTSKPGALTLYRWNSSEQGGATQ